VEFSAYGGVEQQNIASYRLYIEGYIEP